MLQRIPFMFLMLGAIYAVLGLVSILMIREPLEAQSENTSLKEAAGPEEDFNLRPTEVLRTLTFYQVNILMCLVDLSIIKVHHKFCNLQIWVGFFAVGLCNGLMSNYSKSFGLTFINDDHFFASVAIFQNVANGLCRIFWGYAYDRQD